MKPIYQAIIAGAASGLVSKGIDKYNLIDMKSIYQTFIVELWPMWFGLLVGLLYLLVKDYIRIKQTINNLDGLSEWIGIRKSKDYNDLKGKIKCYIREELAEK